MPSQSLLDRGIGVVGFRSVSSFGIRFSGFFDSAFPEKNETCFSARHVFVFSFVMRFIDKY